MRHRAGRHRILVAAALATLLSGCATTRPVPILRESRLPIHVATSDLTGTGLDSLFVATLPEALNRDFLILIQDVTRLVSARDRSWAARVVPNPFSWSDGPEASRITAQGELERAYYGPAQVSDPALAGFVFLGLPGAVIASIGDAGYVAALQYRFILPDLPGQHPLLVQIARTADVKKTSRREQMSQVTADAQEAFLIGLAERLGSDGLVPFSETRFHDTTPDGARAKAVKAQLDQ